MYSNHTEVSPVKGLRVADLAGLLPARRSIDLRAGFKVRGALACPRQPSPPASVLGQVGLTIGKTQSDETCVMRPA